MKILDYIKNNYLIFDGAMGSLLQESGMEIGEYPENLNIEQKELIQNIHYNYLQAGSNIILTNTFGANSYKYNGQKYSLESVINAAIDNARKAINDNGNGFLAYDIGPLGALLEPAGTISFEQAYTYYQEIVLIASKKDIDVFVVETQSDLLELKAAILAIKENSNKPVFATMTFEEDATTLLGNDICSIVATLEGLKVDAIGLNCGFGPKQMLPLVKEFIKYSSLPIMIQPNAGIPDINGNYDIDAKKFAEYYQDILNENVHIVGGCCGTKYEHIKLLKQLLDQKTYKAPIKKDDVYICSGQRSIKLNSEDILIIGERINPTGKSKMQEALKKQNYQEITKEALIQEEEGSHVLDVNVGIPNGDEVNTLKAVVKEIQAYTSLPLQIDSSNIEAIEQALRVYCGIPIINSVNAKVDNLEKLLPIASKYGAVLIGLCIDEEGLALTKQKKIELANKIITRANHFGIDKNKILIDPLTLTASSQQEDVKATLDAIAYFKTKNINTIIGASNVSFGLPNRNLITASFITMALYAGLKAMIINTSSKEVKASIRASKVLLNYDKNAIEYIDNYQNNDSKMEDNNLANDYTLIEAIQKGLDDVVLDLVKNELKTRDALDIIENDIVVSLDIVGKKFETKQLFLPQLIKSAQSVSKAFEIIKEKIIQAKDNNLEVNKEKILLATVYGDVHDIGKNIVKVLLENYGYEVIDLGKNVSNEKIVETINKENIKLVGLSALMSTTVTNMKEAIAIIKKIDSNINIMVGGAVLTEQYAKEINADYYCKDALSGVDVAKKVLK